MSEEFFKTLLENCEIKLDEELLNHHLWSRFSFTFEVLVSLLGLMPKDNYFLRICGLLASHSILLNSWILFETFRHTLQFILNIGFTINLSTKYPVSKTGVSKGYLFLNWYISFTFTLFKNLFSVSHFYSVVPWLDCREIILRWECLAHSYLGLYWYCFGGGRRILFFYIPIL